MTIRELMRYAESGTELQLSGGVIKHCIKYDKRLLDMEILGYSASEDMIRIACIVEPKKLVSTVPL